MAVTNRKGLYHRIDGEPPVGHEIILIRRFLITRRHLQQPPAPNTAQYQRRTEVIRAERRINTVLQVAAQ